MDGKEARNRSLSNVIPNRRRRCQKCPNEDKRSRPSSAIDSIGALGAKPRSHARRTEAEENGHTHKDFKKKICLGQPTMRVRRAEKLPRAKAPSGKGDYKNKPKTSKVDSP